MRLLEARRRAGYSTREFARATSSSMRTIWELEKGRRLPQLQTIRKFAGTLAVAVEDVDEFREAIWREALRNAPPEVVTQVEQTEVFEVELPDEGFFRVAAQRSLYAVMQYMIDSGHPEDVDAVYRKLRGKADGREEVGKAKTQDLER